MRIEDIYEEEKPEQATDFNKIFDLIRRQWHWLLLLGFLGLAIAYMYTKIKIPRYKANISILIPESPEIIDMKNLFAGTLFNQPKTNIYNQIEIISSYYNINQTLINLNWRTSLFIKEYFTWRGVYKNEPFYIHEPNDFINPKGIKIYVSPTVGETYRISVDGELSQENQVTHVKFEKNGQFGQRFKNEYFNFTLYKKDSTPITPGKVYYFVFNDLNEITLAYHAKLKAVLKDKKSDIIECSVEGEDLRREVDFLNELIQVYINGKLDLHNKAQLRTLEFINGQLAGISDSLNSTGSRFTDFRSKNNIIDLGTEGTLIMNNLKELETQKAQSQIQLDYFKGLLSYLNNKGGLDKMISPSVVGIQDELLNSLVLKLGELYNRRQILSFSAKENNVTIVLIDREIASTRERLGENLRNLINNATKSIQTLDERISRINTNMNKLPQKEQQMVNIQRQFNLTSEIYTFLLQRRAETNIALASKIPDVQIIDAARIETTIPIGLSTKVIIMLGFFLGLAVPVGFIEFLNLFNVKIQTQEDIENNTSLPIAGNIVHDQFKSELTVNDHPHSVIAESFRTLRTNLQFMVDGLQGRIISIHSVNPNEGKTFISRNLATIIAMNDKKVLLIDADLRKPKLHKTFELSNELGLSTYLINQNSYDDIIFPTVIKNLFVIPSGPIPPNPSELLGKPEMKDLLLIVRQNYDYIIIDNPPIALVTDGVILSHLSDLNLFILRYGFSHKYHLNIINQLSEKHGIEHPSILVNDIKNKSFGYTYYKYYQYDFYHYTDTKKKEIEKLDNSVRLSK